jgi:type IV secretion system protein VirD4
MKKDSHTAEYIVLSIFVIPIIWIALLIAPYIDQGLLNVMIHIHDISNSPFSITWSVHSLSSVSICILLYVFIIMLMYVNKKNYRRKEEHGSATWGKVKQINKKYEAKSKLENKILTQNMHIGLNGYLHRRNVNTMVVGGSGAGKTRFFAKPNIMQCNTSYVILDPKGETLRATGKLLEQQGYKIKVVDLITMHKSHCYNPFAYIQDDKDVLKLITNLIRNTTPKGAQSSDPFWEKSEMALLEGLCLYLLHEAPKEEQNFNMVMEMIIAAEVKEDDEEYQSPLDILFERLAMREPESLAVKQYHIYKQAAGKTAKSILISVGVRLAAFNLPSLSSITTIDELELHQMGEEKTALFAVIPDNDSSFNFIVGMLYTQLFQQLYYQADFIHDGRLPLHVHFVMDEFANVALPDEFDKLLSTMRSREISVSIILQNLAQIKALYKDSWESIVGNCDEFLYLGGNEQSTHKYVSELLGKETIDTNTYGKSSGRSGNYSTNYQQSGRELLTPDEVRMLDNAYALLFIRGERPIYDKKYDIMKHPNIHYIHDGGAEAYYHGKTDKAIDWQTRELLQQGEYELLDEQDLYELYHH